MVAPQFPPAVSDAVADAIDRLAIVIAERGAKLEDYSRHIDGLLQGDYCSWRQAYTNLGLHTFSGAPDQWLCFYRAYKESASYFSVDENRKRLYSSLCGAARDHARPLVSAGFTADRILTSLETHFDLVVAVASRLLESIDKLVPLHEGSRPNEFVVFATQVERIVSELSLLSKTHYLHDPRLAMKVINRMNEHNRERWRAYANFAPDLPILKRVSTFLNEQVAKVCSFSRAWVRPPASRPAAVAEELWAEARKHLENLPRLEPAAPAHRVVLFAALLGKVVRVVSARDKWLLVDEQVYHNVLDRLSPRLAWRWFEYAARRRAAPEPELATLAACLAEEAARAAADSAPASRHHHIKVKASSDRRPGCLCRGCPRPRRCRARRAARHEQLRPSPLGAEARRVSAVYRHHTLLHTNNSILS